MPNLSIVTVVYNDLNGIKKTIKSVSSLKYRDFEYIVVDGNSDDGTKEFLENNRDKITKLISEKDNGIYDAMNKGILNCKGKYIHILNAGDTYFENDLFNNDIFEKNKDFIAFSVLKRGKKDRIWQPHFSNLYKSIRISHPGLIVKNNFYKNVGNYSLNFKYISDSIFILKNVNIDNVTFHNQILVDMEWGGITTIPTTQNLKERLILINNYNINFFIKVLLKVYTFFIHMKSLYLR